MEVTYFWSPWMTGSYHPRPVHMVKDVTRVSTRRSSSSEAPRLINSDAAAPRLISISVHQFMEGEGSFRPAGVYVDTYGHRDALTLEQQHRCVNGPWTSHGTYFGQGVAGWRDDPATCRARGLAKGCVTDGHELANGEPGTCGLFYQGCKIGGMLVRDLEKNDFTDLGNGWVRVGEKTYYKGKMQIANPEGRFGESSEIRGVFH
jgi:hypothetical protein